MILVVGLALASTLPPGDNVFLGRELLKPAVEAFGLRVEDSAAGLYLWCTAGEDTWETIGRLADLGIVPGSGTFYGEAGSGYVRIALTATDERVAAAARRLRG
mgnify:CR=1 FL=1